MRPYRLGLGLGLLLMAYQAPVWAWSDFVHELVCDMAYQRLSAQGRYLVQRLNNDENRAQGYDSFGVSCQWADEVRHSTHKSTYDYHFINVPRGDEYSPVRDCAAHDCVSQAVRRYALYLADEHRGMDQRAAALRFLGHFVGDIHQPLHVGYKEDRGGNDIHVFWRESEKNTRLHAVWDGAIAYDMGLADADTARRLNAQITEQEQSQWSSLNIDDWAADSFVLARDAVYVEIDGEAVGNEMRLGEAYYQRARPIVQEQIKKAAVRLAILIDKAAAGELNWQMMTDLPPAIAEDVEDVEERPVDDEHQSSGQ